MKKAILIVLGLMVTINAQGITNTLGGNTSADKFIVENSDSEAGLIVTGEGNVGIGTASPSVKLDVAGQVKISGGTPGTGKVLTSDATGLATWETPGTGADNLGNHTATQNVRLNGNWLSGDGGNEGVFVHANGNVGIGIDTPAEKLHIAGNLRLNGGFFDKDGDNGTSGQILSSTGTQTNWIDAPSGGSGDGHSLDAADGAPVDAVFVDNAGNVGIGTTNPIEKLDVFGAIRIYHPHETTGEIKLGGPSGGVGIALWSNEPERYRANIVRNKDGFGFGVHAADTNPGMGNLYIRNDGNVGIGTTNPLSKLSVGGDGSTVSAIYGEASGSAGCGVYGYATNSGTVTNHGGVFIAAGSDGRGVYGEASGSFPVVA